MFVINSDKSTLLQLEFSSSSFFRFFFFLVRGLFFPHLFQFNREAVAWFVCGFKSCFFLHLDGIHHIYTVLLFESNAYNHNDFRKLQFVFFVLRQMKFPKDFLNFFFIIIEDIEFFCIGVENPSLKVAIGSIVTFSIFFFKSILKCY